MNLKKYIEKVRVTNIEVTISEFISESSKDSRKYPNPYTCAVLDKGKLVGSLSYGDIKRKFDNLEKNQSIKKLMNKHPVKIELKNNKKILLPVLIKLFEIKNVDFVYVVNNDFLIGVLNKDTIYNFKHIEFCNTVIFGQGFVGLTLLIHLAKNKLKSMGIDKDKKLISNLKKNISKVNENGLLQILKKSSKNGVVNFQFSLKNPFFAKIFIITVGTPVVNNKIKEEQIFKCLLEISKNFTKGSLIILRSTIPVGSSRTSFIPFFEKLTNMKCGEDWHYAFAPERTIEGNALKELETLPQLLAGYTNKCYEKASNYFLNFSSEIVELETLEMAELSKLICNTFRDLSFAFANDLALLGERYNIDANKLIYLTNKGYPRGGIPKASPGVGGACLSKDPIIYSISNKDTKFYKSKLGLISREINLNSAKVPIRVLNKYKSNLYYKKINLIILGLSFKGDFPNTDTRDSNAKKFADYCLSKNYNTFVYDPYFNKKEITGYGYKYFNIEESVKKNIDFIFLLNNCEIFKNIDLSNWILSKNLKVFFDGWGILPELNLEINNYHYTTMGKLE